jgi:RimJ/RimL family protein N-acetyltransferase
MQPPFIHEGMDVRHYLKWLENKEVMQYSENRHLTHSTASQYEWICSFDQENDYLWEIIRCGMPIGSISAYLDIPNRIANLGVMIGDDSHWNFGYGREAWDGVCKWLFSQDTRKIEAGCMACNKPMIRLLEKCGFRIEATIPGHFLLNGKPTDQVCYGKTQKAKVIPIARANHGSGVLGPTGDAA